MESKKRLSWELITLGLVIVLAGGFIYLQQKNISVIEVWGKIMGQIKPINQQKVDAQRERILTEENYKNFVRSNSLDDLFNSEQYKQLQGFSVNINIEEGVGNPEPFNKPKVEVNP
ncbi:MAG: hypothetical protein WCV69_01585 [Patescibacteria group bacterium]|jgi:hypothetical protein